MCDATFQRETELFKIEEEIRRKKQLLIAKKAEIEKRAITNQFLEGVKRDYNNYYTIIREEKEKQKHAFEKLYDYLAKINRANSDLEEDIASYEWDKEQIVNEIEKIKNDITELD